MAAGVREGRRRDEADVTNDGRCRHVSRTSLAGGSLDTRPGALHVGKAEAEATLGPPRDAKSGSRAETLVLPHRASPTGLSPRPFFQRCRRRAGGVSGTWMGMQATGQRGLKRPTASWPIVGARERVRIVSWARTVIARITGRRGGSGGGHGYWQWRPSRLAAGPRAFGRPPTRTIAARHGHDRSLREYGHCAASCGARGAWELVHGGVCLSRAVSMGRRDRAAAALYSAARE